jgi:hypothetical protein
MLAYGYASVVRRVLRCAVVLLLECLQQQHFGWEARFEGSNVCTVCCEVAGRGLLDQAVCCYQWS